MTRRLTPVRGAAPVPSEPGPGGPAAPPQSRAETIDLFARTLWAEAQGRPLRAIEALAAMIVNRAGRPGTAAMPRAVAAACLAPGAFAAWRDDATGAAARAVPEADPLLAVCRRVARLALAGALGDPTGGATRCHPEDQAPAWASGCVPAAEIGGLLFYSETE
jgi:spore germination cell wall hydrolase CwlJ-like protein